MEKTLDKNFDNYYFQISVLFFFARVGKLAVLDF